MARQDEKDQQQPALDRALDQPIAKLDGEERDKGKAPQNQVRSNFDIFYEQEVYPDAASVFSFRPATIEQIKNDCLVVLDTSVLLLPYGFNEAALGEIERTYQRLSKEKRLIVPGQAAREFAKNRGKKLADMFNTISQRKAALPGKDALPGGTDKSYRLLEEIEEYKQMLEQEQGMLKLAAEINKKKKEYVSAIDSILAKIAGWNWDDPISLLYGKLFTAEVVIDRDFEKDNMRVDHSRRKTHSLPPGYKDSEREVGDLLIWHTILDIGRERAKSVIFVSGDDKADWRVRAEGGKPLYARYELVDEFRRASGGSSFYIMELSQLLHLYGASEAIVEQVRTAELQIDSENSFLTRTARGRGILMQALLVWLRRSRTDVSRDIQSIFFQHNFRMDVLLNDGKNLTLFGEVLLERDHFARLHGRMPDYLRDASERSIRPYLIIIAKDHASAESIISYLIEDDLNMLGGIRTVVGFLGPFENFFDIGRFNDIDIDDPD